MFITIKTDKILLIMVTLIMFEYNSHKQTVLTISFSLRLPATAAASAVVFSNDKQVLKR